MFVHKKKYFFIIESIKKINLDNLKNINKFNIIYRTVKIKDKKEDLLKFRKMCKRKRIDFYVANDTQLLKSIQADGIYISAHNKNLKYKFYKKMNYKIIGSAHNLREIKLKKLQGCTTIFLSRLFKTNYKGKNGHLGIVKYNLSPFIKSLSALGGINKNNFNKLRCVKSDSFALSSAFIEDNSINKLFY